MNLVVVIPSRGRPSAARRTITALRDTAVRPSTKVVLALDHDDPSLPTYRSVVRLLPRPAFGWDAPSIVVLEAGETGNLVKATNTVSMRIAAEDPTAIIANLGDDHRPRTPAWDRAVVLALQSPGVAYGDDLYQRQELPTAPFISAAIVNALGWYALPELEHQFIDNVWRDIGSQTGTLRYLPEVVIEHLHPFARKAQWDEGYERANSDEAIRRDGEAYGRWREDRMAADIELVRAALAVAA